MESTKPKSKTLLIAIGAALLLLVGGASYFFFTSSIEKLPPTDSNQGTDLPGEAPTTPPPSTDTLSIIWQFNGQEWTPSSTAPQCEEPIVLDTPVDISKATAILYPGQTRGGDYKPHGGFRFDNNTDNKVDVTLPDNATLVSGSRYIEAGEVQIMLDFVTPCGLMFRFDHLLTLAPEFADLVDKELPAAKPDDSRTTNFQTQEMYKVETLIATEIGHTSPTNAAVDFGFYDLRSKNEISSNSTWAQAHANESSQAYYARCWLDYLSSKDKQTAYSLPGGGTEGKTSDYCK